MPDYREPEIERSILNGIMFSGSCPKFQALLITEASPNVLAAWRVYMLRGRRSMKSGARE